MLQYQETIQYLYDLQYSGIKLGLQNISALLDYWDNPQNSWPAIHLAGTNGKGSTAAFIYNILRQSGRRVGLYTSPHLVDFSERIRVNDEFISWQTIVKYTDDLKPQIERIKPTFFEATSAIAFRYFAEQKVDVAVIETGLGGRLDATNLVNPKITVITPISMDHQQYLGSTLAEIAGEKAGIIKKNVPCISHNPAPLVEKILRDKCGELHAPFYSLKNECTINVRKEDLGGSRFDAQVENIFYGDLEIPLSGSHQIQNAVMAILALHHFPGFILKEQNLRKGLQQTNWAGRLQIIRQFPLTILDVSHNPHGVEISLKTIRKFFPTAKIWTLVGLVKDKDYQTIGRILEANVNVLGYVENFSDKALSSSRFMSGISESLTERFVFQDIFEGFDFFSNEMKIKDVLLIVGSHYLAGEFLKKYKSS